MKMILFYEFSPDFGMLFDHFPWMLFFTHGWYWGISISICFSKRDSINKLGTYKKGLFLYVLFLFWDAILECIGTLGGLWTYHWAPHLMIWGIFPIFGPFVVSSYNVGLYYVNEYVYTKEKNNGWIDNYLGRIIGYYCLFAVLHVIWSTAMYAVKPS